MVHGDDEDDDGTAGRLIAAACEDETASNVGGILTGT